MLPPWHIYKMQYPQMIHIFVARDEPSGQSACSKLIADGYQACFIPLDVTSKISIHNAAVKIKSEYSGLDILINNAGVMYSSSKVSHKMHLFIVPIAKIMTGCKTSWTEYVLSIIHCPSPAPITNMLSLGLPKTLPTFKYCFKYLNNIWVPNCP